MIQVTPVILCGGSGTRLWPLSRTGFPKQFLCLTGNESLFQQAGDESAFHRDFPLQFAASARTAVWYPVSRWDRDWGGDFVTLNSEGEVDACTLVKPNRLLLFNGTQTHAARPISRYCGELRIAVSFATEVVGDNRLEVDHA